MWKAVDAGCVKSAFLELDSSNNKYLPWFARSCFALFCLVLLHLVYVHMYLADTLKLIFVLI